jgi:putative copper export protein
MTGLAEPIEITTYTGKERERRLEWAPYRAAKQEDQSRVRSRFSGLGVIAAFLLFSGITVAVARGNAGLAESYDISPESLLGASWMVQGAAALVCFVLAIRWLRS